jgi:hypothetical protein
MVSVLGADGLEMTQVGMPGRLPGCTLLLILLSP